MARSRKKDERGTSGGRRLGPSGQGESREVSSPPGSRRKLWFRVLSVAAVLLVVWGIPELIVRMANPRLEAYRAIVFGSDPNSPELFMKDWRLHWKLRPEVKTTFLQTSVRTDRYGFRGDGPVPGNRLVLCLGDSTVFGWRVEEAQAFPARLRALLNRPEISTTPWDVINAGAPGYTSFQVRLLAEKLVPRWKPEVIVVCVGNNEAWPAEQSDRQIDADRTVTGILVHLLTKSRFLLWASEMVRSQQPQPFIAPDMTTAVPRVTRGEYGGNLRQIVRIARAANAKLVFLTSPVNLYRQPVRFDQYPEWEQWKPFYAEVETVMNAGNQRKAIEMVNSAHAQNPDSYHALWIKGAVLSDLGDVDGGRELLEQAIEHHSFPENCPRSYRNVVAEIAREKKISFVDVNDLFRRRANAPTPEDMYLDRCHPTPRGHGFIADALFETIAGDKD